ncbi:MAG: hypothetical protein WC565_03075 [Parcubacteria group bacterium]
MLYHNLTPEPTDAPDDRIACVLDYGYLPEAGITHAQTWIIRTYEPDAPESEVLDYARLSEHMTREQAEEWAAEVIRRANQG